jgi:hypothetical protein
MSGIVNVELSNETVSRIRRALLLKPYRNVASELIGDTTAAGRRSNKILPTEDVVGILTAVLDAVKAQATMKASAVDEDDASFISGFSAASLSDASTVNAPKRKGKDIVVRVQHTDEKEQVMRMNESDTINDLAQAYARATDQCTSQFGFVHNWTPYQFDCPFTLRQVSESILDASPILMTVTARYR